MRTQVLMIDDQRDVLSYAPLYVDEPFIARQARNYADGIKALESQHWDYLLLDHDLGDFEPHTGKELTGYSILCWLEQNPDYLPGKIIIVSSNPVGRENMQRVIDKLYAD